MGRLVGGDNGLGVLRAVAVHVVDGLLQPFHAFHRQLGPQILGLPVGLAGEHGIGRIAGHGKPGRLGDGEHARIAVDEHTGLLHVRENGRQHRIGHRRVHQERLGSVAHTKAAALRVPDDGAGHLGVGGGVHVHVAVARARLDDRYFGMLHAMADKARATPGDEHVHQAVQPHEHIGGRPIGGGHRADGALRQPRFHGSRGQHVGDDLVGAGRKAAAPQDACVAGLHADPGGVGSHVGPGLVDHGHHPEGHRHAPKLDAVVEGRFQRHDAERIGQRRHLLQGVGRGKDAGLVQHEPVQQRLGGAGRARRLHVLAVGLNDGRRLRPQGRRHGVKRPVALLGRRLSQLRARRFCEFRQFAHFLFQSHGPLLFE